MEAVAAFGLACNVGQVIGQATSVIKMLQQLHEEGSTRDHASLQLRSTQLQKLMEEVLPKGSLQNGTNAQSQSRVETELQDVASRCHATTTVLCKELSGLQSQGGKRNMARTALKVLKKKSTLVDLEEQLQKQRQSLETVILVGLRQQIHDQGLLQKGQIEALDKRLASGVETLRLDDMQLKQLIENMRSACLQQIVDSQRNIQAHIKSQYDSMRLETQSHLTRNRLLESLKFREMNARINQISDAEEGTYQRILDLKPGYVSDPSSEQRLVNWISSGTGLFWIQGKAGSGKSTLMRCLWQHARTGELLRESHLGRQCIILKYGFWLSGTRMQKSLHGLYMSLLHQLLQGSLDRQQTLLMVYPDMVHKKYNEDWSVKELIEALRDTIQGCGSKVCLFVDGLDEIGSRSEYPKFLQFVKVITTSFDVKACVSSRPETYWTDTLAEYEHICLQEINANDIRTYILNQLAQAGHVVSDHDKGAKRLVLDMMVKAQGVFLWVRLAMDSVLKALDGCATWPQVIAVVDGLPPQIVDLYSAMLAKIGQNDATSRAEAAVYFQACVRNPRFQPGTTTLTNMIMLRARLYNESLFESAYGRADLLNSGRMLLKRISHLSAGMIESTYTGSLSQAGRSRKNPRDIVVTTTDYYIPGFSLSHRTVLDFLLDTEPGKNLLAASPLSDSDISFSTVESHLMHCLLNMESFQLIEAVATLRPHWSGSSAATSIEHTWAKALRLIEQVTPRLAIAHNKLSSRTRQLMASDQEKAWPNIQFDIAVQLKGDVRYWYRSIAIDIDGLALEHEVYPFTERALLSTSESGQKSTLCLSRCYKEYLLLCSLPNERETPAAGANNGLISTLVEQGVDPYAAFFLPLSEPTFVCGITELLRWFYLTVHTLDEKSRAFWTNTLSKITIKSRRCLIHVAHDQLHQYSVLRRGDLPEIWIELDVAIYLRDVIQRLQSYPSPVRHKQFLLRRDDFNTMVMLGDKVRPSDKTKGPVYVSLLSGSDSQTVLGLIDDCIESRLARREMMRSRAGDMNWEELKQASQGPSHDFIESLKKLHKPLSVPRVERTAFFREKGYLPDPSDPHLLKGPIPRFEAVLPVQGEQQPQTTAGSVPAELQSDGYEDEHSGESESVFFDAEE